ncbi:MAG: alpha/beta hydrolase [Anaerolineaceae bacterium]|nr:alpha/beta hydrolase [Anaerolineaceae bacterium]
MNRKTLLIVLGIIVILIIIVVILFLYMSSQPLYRPGMVRREENLSAPLDPPEQIGGSSTWLVETGIALEHFADGEGRNVLVIHGGPGQPFDQPGAGLSLLNDSFRFHYYAQRGCGESTRPIDRFDSPNIYQNMQTLDRTLGLGAQIADIERIRHILGEEKLILVGHSWGAFLASLYAAEFPDHVEALVLVSPANTLIMPQPDTDSDLFASVREQLNPEEQAVYDTFMEEYFDFGALFQKSEADLIAMNEKFGEYYMMVMDVEALESPDELPEQGKPGGWMVWAQYVSMGQRHDYSQALGDVQSPVLVIHGAEDLQSEAASRMYAEAFANAQFVIIPDASHASFEDQPEQFAQIVGAFLKR